MTSKSRANCSVKIVDANGVREVSDFDKPEKREDLMED
jgi:hypothetical protein